MRCTLDVLVIGQCPRPRCVLAAGATLHLILDRNPHARMSRLALQSPRGNLVERSRDHEDSARRSVDDLVAAIDAYLHETNRHPKPFVWTASVEAILEKIDRCKDISETLH